MKSKKSNISFQNIDNESYFWKMELNYHNNRMRAIKTRKTEYGGHTSEELKIIKNYKSISNNLVLKKKLINRDNEILSKRLDKIYQRHPVNDGYKYMKFINIMNRFFQCTRESEQKKIKYENQRLANRLDRTMSELNSKKFLKEFNESRKISIKLRRIKPKHSASQSMISILDDKTNKKLIAHKKKDINYYQKIKNNFNLSLISTLRNSSQKLLPKIK